jgi:hypothetical protein
MRGLDSIVHDDDYSYHYDVVVAFSSIRPHGEVDIEIG